MLYQAEKPMPPRAASELELEVPDGASTVSHMVVTIRDGSPSVQEDELAVEEPLDARRIGPSP
jgi:hypothetical protein